MAWNPPTDAQIQQDQPVGGVSGFGEATKDSLEYLYAQLGTLSAGLKNPSFEIEGSVAGTAEAWTFSTYPAGAVSRVTTDNAQGEACIKMTHSGGAGNGGGYATSDYVAAREGAYMLALLAWATVHGIHCAADLYYYDEGKVFISSDRVWDSQGLPLTPTAVIGTQTAPANTRYIKVRLLGGINDIDIAGTAYFDDASLIPLAATDPPAVDNTEDVSIAEQSTSLTTWTEVGSQTLDLDLLDGDASGVLVRLTFSGEVWGGTGPNTGYMRFRVGTAYSNVISGYAAAWTTTEVSIDVSGLTSPSITIYMELYSDGGGSGPSKGLVDNADTKIQLIT
jgi:hypothetical protein